MADKKKQSSILKDAIALFIITVIAGGLLGYVNFLTKQPIMDAEQKAKTEAYQKVMEKAEEFTNNMDLSVKLEQEAEKTEGVILTEVLEAKDKNGSLIGYVMSVTDKEGYGGDITLSLGFDTEGGITGFEVLSASSETPGLGANCQTEEFKKQFVGITGEQVEYTKSGKSKENEIDALSGATITTKGIVKSVNAALSFMRENAWNGK